MSLPPKIEDWDAVHVGAWLAVHMGLPPKGLKAIRNGLDGMKLLEMTKEQLQTFLDTTLDDDLSSKMHSLIETGRYGSKQVASYIDNVEREQEQAIELETERKVEKKKKKKTMMSLRNEINKKNVAVADTQEDFEFDEQSEVMPPPSYERSEAVAVAQNSSMNVVPLTGNEEMPKLNEVLGPDSKNKRYSSGPSKILLDKKTSGSNNVNVLNKTVTFETPEKLKPEVRGDNSNHSGIFPKEQGEPKPEKKAQPNHLKQDAPAQASREEALEVTEIAQHESSQNRDIQRNAQKMNELVSEPLKPKPAPQIMRENNSGHSNISERSAPPSGSDIVSSRDQNMPTGENALKEEDLASAHNNYLTEVII